MAKRYTHLDMNGDDIRAARVLTLVVKFFGASRPIPSSTIAADLYPNLEEGSFRRQFFRDRELLAGLGVVIREVEGPNDDTLWQVDGDTSYIRGAGISDHDARMLYALCYDMGFDQSFPYRDELRIALAKMAQMYHGSAFALTDTTSKSERKVLATLVSCMTARHAVAVTYTNALGVTSERTLALLGSFGLRDHSYFVAQAIDEKGGLLPASPRTYRLDRFSKARELARLSYRIPQDFVVSDYIHLPFQIGSVMGTASLLVDEKPSSEVERAMSMSGTSRELEGHTVWDIPFSNAQALSSWAVAHRLVPLAPQGLCDVWRTTLQDALASNAFDPSLAETVGNTQGRTASTAGRKGSAATVRQLIALATSLTKEGRAITANDIAASLGISFDEARHLIALVSMGSGESIDYLPLVLGDEDDEVALMEGASLSARRLRLTRSETYALLAALSRIGLDQDDPLVKTLADSYADTSLTYDEIVNRLSETRLSTDTDVLRQCSQALTEGLCLTFSYRPVDGGPTTRRRVSPQLLRQDNGFWYLEAYDQVRRGQRIFRLDGMSDVEPIAFRGPVRSVAAATNPATIVTVRFCDRQYLDLFHWDGLQLLEQGEDGTVAKLPFYGGSWLARHLAACAGTVQVSDRGLAEQMQSYARELLGREARHISM